MSIERLSKFLKQQGYKLSLSLGEFNLSKTSLGQGGNALVYEASFLQKVVAIKFLITESTGHTREQKLKRFLAEYVNIISIHDQSNIVRYIDYDLLKFTDDEGDLEIPVIIMKKYDGSLAKEREKKEIDRERFLSLFNFLVNTVEKIHNSGIIHRDIKPENILIDGYNFVLADFGIASFNPEMFTIKALTGKKERLGNRLFSAPEQEDSGIEPHETMDIYAIGQVLQWYVTGKTHRGTGRQTIKSVFNDLGIYDQIIDLCLKNNQLDRPQLIHEIKSLAQIVPEPALNVWKYLSLFSLICARNFPKTNHGFAYTNSIERIDSFLESLQQKEAEFGRYLWWLNGTGSSDFSLVKKERGRWKFKDIEYNIDELWVHHNHSEYNDFVLVHYLPSEPFYIEGEESYFSILVDGQYEITQGEYDNGYAELNDRIVDLSNHKVEMTIRQDEDGYFFIGTRFNCILQWRNNMKVFNFINKIESKKNVEIEDLNAFKEDIREHLHPEVWDGI